MPARPSLPPPGLSRSTPIAGVTGPIVILAGPGNNGGDGFVAARRLAQAGAAVVVVLVAGRGAGRGPDAARNWDRLVDEPADDAHPRARSRGTSRSWGRGSRRRRSSSTPCSGPASWAQLREPIRGAVELINRARAAMVPVLAVDTPTAVDLSSGQPSDPAVRADLTITFHRPKTGLLTRMGAALAGRVLVAPIGIPSEADRG